MWMRFLHYHLQGKITGVLHTKNDSVADVVQSDETVLLYGQDYFYEELLGLKFKISQFSFFQTNSLGAEVLYRDGKRNSWEISLTMAGMIRQSLTCTVEQERLRSCLLLWQVRSSVWKLLEEAVKAARENAKLNNLNNCEFISR